MMPLNWICNISDKFGTFFIVYSFPRFFFLIFNQTRQSILIFFQSTQQNSIHELRMTSVWIDVIGTFCLVTKRELHGIVWITFNYFFAKPGSMTVVRSRTRLCTSRWWSEGTRFPTTRWWSTRAPCCPYSPPSCSSPHPPCTTGTASVRVLSHRLKAEAKLLY